MQQPFAWFYWDPNPEMFRIPYFDHPVAWYGLCWVIGFILGYYLLIPIFKRKLAETIQDPQQAKSTATLLADRMIWLIVIGAVVGARLGHVFLYDNWDYYSQNLWEIAKTWKGGLASHGGAVGVLLALLIFKNVYLKKYMSLSYIQLLDLVVIPATVISFWIRIGNFINQEILGVQTTVPWAVIFGHPIDHSAVVPRHPVALYEAFSLLVTFVILYVLWKRYAEKLPTGLLSGLFFVLVFASRFVIEFYKVHQSEVIDESFLQMGQYLSIPFIIAGLILLFRSKIQKYLRCLFC